MDRLQRLWTDPRGAHGFPRSVATLLMTCIAVSPTHGAPAPLQTQALAPAFEPRDAALDCLASAIAHEAGNEPLAGREAIAQVVMNRLRTPAYPKTVCGVVFQGAARHNGCQFTFACDGALQRPLRRQTLDAARQIAAAALDRALPDRVGSATHYHAYYVAPSWASMLQKVGRIGAHIFYQPAGSQLSGASPLALTPAITHAMPQSPPSLSGPFSAWGLPLDHHD